MIETFAVLPAYRPVGLPVTEMTTGKALVPEEDEATIPTELTRPNTGVVEPVAVIVTWSPWAIFATSAAPTEALTMYEPVLITWICPVELVELLEPDDPLEAED